MIYFVRSAEILPPVEAQVQQAFGLDRPPEMFAQLVDVGEDDMMLMEQVEMDLDIQNNPNINFAEIFQALRPAPDMAANNPNVLVNFILDAGFEVEGPPDFMGVTKRWDPTLDEHGNLSYSLHIKIDEN